MISIWIEYDTTRVRFDLYDNAGSDQKLLPLSDKVIISQELGHLI